MPIKKPDWIYVAEHNEKIEDEARQLWIDVAKSVAAMYNVTDKTVPAKWADEVYEYFINKFKKEA